MKIVDILNSPVLLIMVIIGLAYIVGFSLLYLKKAYSRCLALGVSKEKLSAVIKSSLIFTIVPSLSIVIGLFALIPVVKITWAWWRLSVIGSLSYETQIVSGITNALKYGSGAELLASTNLSDIGVVLIIMSVGMLSGFCVLIPLGKKLCLSVAKTDVALLTPEQQKKADWKMVLSGCFMLTLFSVYVPILLITDTIQALVMIVGLIIAIVVGILAKKPGLGWLNNFVMALSMVGGMASALLWVKIFG